MRRRKWLVLLLGLGAMVALRSRRETRRAQVTLVYDDGSALTLDAGTPNGDRLLALARPALALR